MKVPKQVLKIWRKRAPHGIQIRMAKHTGLSPRTIYRAVREGHCSPNTYEAINNYLEVQENRKRVFVETFKNIDDGN